MTIKKILSTLAVTALFIPSANAEDAIDAPAFCVAEPEFLAFVEQHTPLVEVAESAPAMCVADAEFTKKYDEPTVALNDAAMDDGELSEYRGAKGFAFTAGDMIVSKVNQGGTVANNNVYGGVTGNNFLGDDAFSGNYGINTAIQNSGNGVLIQSATVVNIQMQ